MGWSLLKYSRGEIDRAGDLLRAETDNPEEYFRAYVVMDNWRTSHAFPLNTIQMTLRRRSRDTDRNAIVAQRLKRAPSIIAKLSREKGMKLSRMQDIGGCRAIVSNKSAAYDILNQYRKSRDRHQEAGFKDYIKTPKESGYRGIHIIYRYQSDRNAEYNNHRVEIQIRTSIQHAWATAVEIAGAFTNSSLKSSIGPSEWIDFFKVVGSAFSFIEDEVYNDHAKAVFEEAIQRDFELRAIESLIRFSNAHKTIETKGRLTKYALLILDAEEAESSIEYFDNLQAASEAYSSAERAYKEKYHIDVVLVSADSVDALARAYPNYFADTQKFLELFNGMSGALSL